MLKWLFDGNLTNHYGWFWPIRLKFVNDLVRRPRIFVVGDFFLYQVIPLEALCFFTVVKINFQKRKFFLCQKLEFNCWKKMLGYALDVWEPNLGEELTWTFMISIVISNPAVDLVYIGAVHIIFCSLKSTRYILPVLDENHLVIIVFYEYLL